MTIKIREAFWGAGTTMGWDIKRWGQHGAGFSKTRIEKLGDQLIYIKVGKIEGGDNPWRIKASEIKEWAEEQNSIDIKKGTKLYVIPLKWLDEHHTPLTDREMLRLVS